MVRYPSEVQVWVKEYSLRFTKGKGSQDGSPPPPLPGEGPGVLSASVKGGGDFGVSVAVPGHEGKRRFFDESRQRDVYAGPWFPVAREPASRTSSPTNPSGGSTVQVLGAPDRGARPVNVCPGAGNEGSPPGPGGSPTSVRVPIVETPRAWGVQGGNSNQKMGFTFCTEVRFTVVVPVRPPLAPRVVTQGPV